MGFPPSVWSTRGRRRDDPNTEAVILYAEGAAIDDLFLGMEHQGLRLTTTRPSTQQQEEPLISNTARKTVDIFCRVSYLTMYT